MSGELRASSGIAALDDILAGGFVQSRLHLVEGAPGTGKTTLGLQFLQAGRSAGEKTLYIALSETGDELNATAQIAKWLGTSTEISEIVEAREALASSRDELERLVAVRTKNLADANTRLTQEIGERIRAEQALLQAQKLESIGQLTSGVAQDFNNLLHAVLGNIEMARQRIKETRPSSAS